MTEGQTGLILLCCCTASPMAIGFLLAWGLFPRVARYGWRLALLPRFIRERIQRELEK